MLLQGKTYVPTLAIRPGEMNGLEYLPGLTKDRMQPCFLLAPWANSLSLKKAVIRLERAFPNRSYFLDIDRDYYSDREADAQLEFDDLKDPANGFRNWVQFTAQYPLAWPCVQIEGRSKQEIQTQISSIQAHDRPYCLRICMNRHPMNLGEVLDAFAEGHSDFAIILDAGWVQGFNEAEAWFDRQVGRILQKIGASVPIVLSCTSIPNEYTEFNGTRPTAIGFENRQVMQNVQRRHNRARIIYGDWGSTRPRDPTNQGHRSRPLDRIDYPVHDAWLIARNKDLRWTFRDAAKAILQSEFWHGNLGVWGEEMIRNTTINQEIGVNSGPKNIAARVNIHLHRQAFYNDTPPPPKALDESWKD